MKRLLYLSFLVFGVSCETDIVAPCSGDDALFGSLCSEFKLKNGAPVGTVEYAYFDGGKSLITDFIDPNGNVQRTVRYAFKDGAVLTERETINGEEKTKSFSYNDQDSVSSIAYFTGASIDSITFCDFENGKRIQVRVQTGDKVLRFDNYRYDSDGTLNRISYHSADSVLLEYRQYEFFGNGKLRIKKKTPQHVVMYTDNIEMNELGMIAQNVRRSSVGDTVLHVTNTYNHQGKLVEKTEVAGIESIAVQYYYYQ